MGEVSLVTRFVSIDGSLLPWYLGWTLVWRYGFTNYFDFQNGNNAIDKTPLFPMAGLDESRPVAGNPPGESDDLDGLTHSNWKQFGTQFMVTLF